ncbi:hypothetical protein BKA59DRAFT_312232 [Fusarium tricinctum]|uniref:Rhodopsin domain-containing protein n=1 Tax=Fusarium tricinctum TaxID=61284 RepID=A0A8K0RPF4_9HYPO|nr:hypothetical protein BKA59DRAFT_312232 [Fusarium tricinctum]
MLILPATQTYRLGLVCKKKIGVIAMFSVGLFLTIVNIIRIPTLIRFNTSMDITTDSEGIVQWSVIEICVGIVVACMPHARQVAGSLVYHISAGERGKNSSSMERIFPERSIGTIAMSP